jgi:hypothetical protein
MFQPFCFSGRICSGFVDAVEMICYSRSSVLKNNAETKEIGEEKIEINWVFT